MALLIPVGYVVLACMGSATVGAVTAGIIVSRKKKEEIACLSD